MRAEVYGTRVREYKKNPLRFLNSLRERYVSNGIYYDYDDCYIRCYCSSVVCGDV